MVTHGASMRISFEGADELMAQLGRLARIAPKEAAEAVKGVAIDIERTAKKNITAQGAVDSGITRANINQWSDDDYKTAEIGLSPSKSTVTVKSAHGQEYTRAESEIPFIASLIEFGHGVIYPKKGKYLRFWSTKTKTKNGTWRRSAGHWVYIKSAPAAPPRPFLYPAFRSEAGALVKKIKASIITIAKGR